MRTYHSYHPSNTLCSLRGPSEVVDRPSIASRKNGINTGTSDEHSEVAKRHIVGNVLSLHEENRVSDDQEGLCTHDERHAPDEPIREQRRAQGRNGSHRVWRCCQELCLGGCETHVLDDLGHGELQAVVGDGIRHEDYRLQVELPICEHLLQYVPVEGLFLVGALDEDLLFPSSAVQHVDDVEEARLIWRKPLGSRWTIGQGEEAHSSYQDGGEPFNDKDPSPALVATQSIHLGDGECEKSRKCARKCRCAVKHCHSALRLVRRIP